MVKALEKITEIKMLGDTWHNEVVDMALKDVDLRLNRNKQIIKAITEAHGEVPRWTPITRTNAKRINGILKSKTLPTWNKRVKNYMDHLANDTHYGKLFNKSELEQLSKLLWD